MRWVLVIVVASACSQPAPPHTPAAPPPRCASVADHVVTLMSEQAQQPTDELDAFRRLVFEHCRDDQWSDDAQQCFLHASSREEAGQRCQSLLTPDQLTALTGGSPKQPESERQPQGAD